MMIAEAALQGHHSRSRRIGGAGSRASVRDNKLADTHEPPRELSRSQPPSQIKVHVQPSTVTYNANTGGDDLLETLLIKQVNGNHGRHHQGDSNFKGAFENDLDVAEVLRSAAFLVADQTIDGSVAAHPPHSQVAGCGSANHNREDVKKNEDFLFKQMLDYKCQVQHLQEEMAKLKLEHTRQMTDTEHSSFTTPQEQHMTQHEHKDEFGKVANSKPRSPSRSKIAPKATSKSSVMEEEEKKEITASDNDADSNGQDRADEFENVVFCDTDSDMQSSYQYRSFEPHEEQAGLQHPQPNAPPQRRNLSARGVAGAAGNLLRGRPRAPSRNGNAASGSGSVAVRRGRRRSSASAEPASASTGLGASMNSISEEGHTYMVDGGDESQWMLRSIVFHEGEEVELGGAALEDKQTAAAADAVDEISVTASSFAPVETTTSMPVVGNETDRSTRSANRGNGKMVRNNSFDLKKALFPRRRRISCDDSHNSREPSQGPRELLPQKSVVDVKSIVVVADSNNEEEGADEDPTTQERGTIRASTSTPSCCLGNVVFMDDPAHPLCSDYRFPSSRFLSNSIVNADAGADALITQESCSNRALQKRGRRATWVVPGRDDSSHAASQDSQTSARRRNSSFLPSLRRGSFRRQNNNNP
jgi:hypothetical protein